MKDEAQTSSNLNMLAIIKSWCNDSRLPDEERQNFKEDQEQLLKQMTKLAQATAPGAWTIETDMWALYNQGEYAPNESLSYLLSQDIIPTLIQKIEWWSSKDPTFLQRFKDATSKRVLVLFPNYSIDNYCESEYADGKLIYHIKAVANIHEWGADLLSVLDAAVQQKGVKLSAGLGEALLHDLMHGEGDKPIAAVRTLIEKDIVDLPMTKEYNYPLFVLINSWKPKLAEMLLPHVKNPNVRDANGETPLIAACRASWTRDREMEAQAKMIEVLLKHPGTDVNATDKHGRTALMYVANTYGWDEAAELLINDPRTDLNFENRKMETALDFAIANKWEWVTKVLRKHRELGTKPSVKVAQTSQAQSTPSAPTSAAIPKAPVKIAYTGSVTSVPPPSDISTPPPPPMMPKSTVVATAPKTNFGGKVSTFGAAPKKSPQFGSAGTNTTAAPTTANTNSSNGPLPPPPPPMAPKATATATTTTNTFTLPKLSPVKKPVQPRPPLGSPQTNGDNNAPLPPLPPMAPKAPALNSTSALTTEQKFSELKKEFNRLIDAYSKIFVNSRTN